MTKTPANDDIKTRGQLVITRGPNDRVVLIFENSVNNIGFTIPEALIVAVGLMETCLQILMEPPVGPGDLPN